MQEASSSSSSGLSAAIDSWPDSAMDQAASSELDRTFLQGRGVLQRRAPNEDGDSEPSHLAHLLLRHFPFGNECDRRTAAIR